ncbi:hypothetical protein ACQPXT_13310 [Streptomyces sp. CA-100214]
MPVEPIPCDDGGTTPVEVTTCCAPSIASAPLCRADGTTILAVVRSGCVECGEAAEAPAVVGWLDTAGTFTPGALPADAGPCDAGCLDTICRQLCDDTDGDGSSDTTYTELYCVRADGTAELVLTYRDDPTVPYTPVSPVECTYGCPEAETVQLCDEVGPFLRRYTWLNGAASFEDFALDGATPYVVTGTVGACSSTAEDCVTTVCRTRCDDADGDGAADTTYTELWCVRADGTAEVVLTYQDDPSVHYTPLAPVECTYASETSETLTLCDDSGPFMRRYSWLGDVASFEDVDLDGTTPHVVTGTVGLCPTAPACEEQTTPAATLGLCLADGTPIAVLVTRDCEGTVTQQGWLNLTAGTYAAGAPPVGVMACGNPRSVTTAGTFCDVDPGTGDVLGLVLIEYTYGADGAVTSVRLVDATTGTTYVPGGEITTCPAGVAQPERDVIQLCDTATDGAVTEFVRDYARDESGAITGHSDYLLDGTPYAPVGTVGRCASASCQDCETVLLCDTNGNPPSTIAGATSSGTLPNGVTYAVTAPSPFIPGRQSDGASWWGTALFPNPVVPTTRWTFNQPVTVEFSVALMYVNNGAAGENTVQLPAGAVPLSLPTGYSYNQTTHVLTAGPALVGAGCTINSPTRATSARFRVTGVSTFTLRYLGPGCSTSSASASAPGSSAPWTCPSAGSSCAPCAGTAPGSPPRPRTPSSTEPRPTPRLAWSAPARPRPRRTRSRSSRTPRSLPCATSPRTAHPHRSCAPSPSRPGEAPRPSRTPPSTARRTPRPGPSVSARRPRSRARRTPSSRSAAATTRTGTASRTRTMSNSSPSTAKATSPPSARTRTASPPPTPRSRRSPATPSPTTKAPTRRSASRPGAWS